MSAAKSADEAPYTVSKASYLPEDLIIMIVDELADMETYNIEESCFLNKHWYYCVTSYKFKSLHVTTKLNDVSMSPHTLKHQLKEGDDLVIDLSRNKMPYEYWEAMDALSNMTGQIRDEKEEDLLYEYWRYDFYIPSLDFHHMDVLLYDLTIIIPGFECTLNTFTYNMEETKCIDLHLISTSEEVSVVSKDILLRSTCATLYTTNLLFEQTRTIDFPMVTAFTMSFTDNCDYIQDDYKLENFMDHLMSILPILEELHITNLKSSNDWILNRGGLPQCVILEDSYCFDISNPKSAKTKAMVLIGKATYANLYGMPLKYLATESFDWVTNCRCCCESEEGFIHDQNCRLPLQVLDASGSDWADYSIEYLRHDWPDLKALNCSNTPVYGIELQEFIEERKDSLEEVVALNCPNLSDETARWIADTVRKTELDVTGRRGYESDFDYSLLDIDTFFEKC